MIQIKYLILSITIFLAFGTQANARELILYGGQNHDEFLGCLVCNEFRSESVCNEFGQYGSEFGSTIWNEFSYTYGNEFSQSSPWNEFSLSNDVPVLVDKDGNFYGYFTINQFRHDAVNFAGDLETIYSRHNGNLEKIRKTLCNWLN